MSEKKATQNKGYTVKNTGAQIVKAPKNVSAPSGVSAIRGKDIRSGK